MPSVLLSGDEERLCPFRVLGQLPFRLLGQLPFGMLGQLLFAWLGIARQAPETC
jgi:hypothetical protein